MSRIALLCTALVVVVSCSTPTVSFVDDSPGFESFHTRCSDKSVVRCFGFESSELASQGGSIHWGYSNKPVGVFVNGKRPSIPLDGRVEVSTQNAASGESSLKFYMPSGSTAAYAGQFYANFSDDLSIQFGEGDEFYIQWRQKFSPEFLNNRYTPYSSWKQIIIGEGDRLGFNARSCSQLEIVVTNKQGAPSLYHSCRGKDGQSEGIPGVRAFKYVANEWMTFQVRVKIGTWYKNDKRYNNDSEIQFWVAREGEPSKLVMSRRYDLANSNGESRYGKVWLLPYLTGKSASQKHPDAYTWFDELIISTTRIADPL